MLYDINIQGIDKNACCGTQLPHLGHLKFLHIIPPGITLTAKPSKSPTRLFFVSGPRGIKYLSQTSKNLSLAAQAIGVGRGDLVDRVGKLDESRKVVMGREKDLRGELAKMVGESQLKEGESKKVIWVKRLRNRPMISSSLGLSSRPLWLRIGITVSR